MASVVATRVGVSARFAAGLPLVIFPAAVVLLKPEMPPWLFMWMLAFAIYAGLKWLSVASSPTGFSHSWARSFVYLLFWPGMDAKTFLDSSAMVKSPSLAESMWALAKTICGGVLVVAAVSLVDRYPTVAGWLGMAGLVVSLHFGLFHLLSIFWRRAGIAATPIMDAPILAASLSDFWGKRWNLAFRDLAHAHVFRPGARRWGTVGATMAVFLVSGIVHDAVISIPAGGGWGLPTLYFAIQGLGVLWERSRLGRRFGTGQIGTRRDVVGRVFAGLVIVGPVFLLFHQSFVDRVIVPMLVVFGSIGS